MYERPEAPAAHLRGVGAALICCLAALVAMAGCGSSGGSPGGGGAVPNLFHGDYYVQMLGVSNLTVDEGSTLWGVWNSDGFGTVAGSTNVNLDGTVYLGGSGGPWTYTIGAGRSVAWQLSGGTSTFEGGISADGSILGITETSSPSIPYAGLLLRRGGAFTVDSLTGNYHVVGFVKGIGSDSTAGFSGAALLAGGVSDTTLEINSDGVIVPASGFIGAYGIAANGDLSWTVDSGAGSLFGIYEGGVLDGGDVAIAAGGSSPGDVPFMSFLMRHATSASLATFAGTYHVVGFVKSLGPTYDAVVGAIVADGSGNVTFTLKRNQDGVVAYFPAVGATYTVEPDGALKVLGWLGGLTGGVLQDGSMGILGGGTLPGDAPGCFFFYR